MVQYIQRKILNEKEVIYMDFPAIIAHRGLHGDVFPENSMGAFREAIKNGLAIELDVHLTKDGRLAVFHDNSLKRMTGVDADIEDFTAQQLGALRLKETDERIPLLSEVLKEVRGRVPLIIEIKEGSSVGITEKRLDRLMKNYKGEWAVMSFNPLRIGWFKKNSPEVTRGMLLSRHKKKFNPEYVKMYLASLGIIQNTIASPDFIAYDLRCVTVKALVKAFNNGCAFLGWTAKNEETLEEALKFCKAVIFENIPAHKAIELSMKEYRDKE